MNKKNNFKMVDVNDVRDINQTIFLHLIRERQPISRADIAKYTGLRAGTVSAIVNRLIKNNFVYEGTEGPSSGGRPARSASATCPAGRSRRRGSGVSPISPWPAPTRRCGPAWSDVSHPCSRRCDSGIPALPNWAHGARRRLPLAPRTARRWARSTICISPSALPPSARSWRSTSPSGWRLASCSYRDGRSMLRRP